MSHETYLSTVCPTRLLANICSQVLCPKWDICLMSLTEIRTARKETGNPSVNVDITTAEMFHETCLITMVATSM